MHGIVEGIVEQISNRPGSEVSITLKVDVEVRSGFDRANVRPLIENANTFGFVEKKVESTRPLIGSYL